MSKPKVLQITGKIKVINDYLFASLYNHVQNPSISLDHVDMVYKILLELRNFYKECEKNHKNHNDKNGV